MKTGVNTSTVIHVHKIKAIENSKGKKKTKQATVCLECQYNKDGHCSKHLGWCSAVSHICNKTKNPHEYKFQKVSNKKKSVKKYKKKPVRR